MMTTLRFILLAYAFLTLFVSGGLFFNKMGQARFMLSLFTLLFGIEIFEFLYSTSYLIKTFPQFYGRWYFISGFLYGPILYLHFRSLIKGENFKILDLLHFFPALIVFALYSHIFFMTGEMRINYMWYNFIHEIMPYNYAREIHVLLYCIYFIYFIYKNYHQIIPQNRLYSIAISSIYFLTTVLISWLTLYANSWRDFIYYYLCTSTVVFIIGYILYRDPDFLKEFTKKYLSSTLCERDMKRISAKIEKVFNEEKIYLSNDLTISKVAEIIDEKSHTISQTFSEYLKVRFNDYTNRYRIEHAKKLLTDPQFNHYKIEAIALESGFNNKVTFNKAFVKFVHKIPSAFRKEVNK